MEDISVLLTRLKQNAPVLARWFERELPHIIAVEWLKLTYRNFDRRGWTEGDVTAPWKARTEPGNDRQLLLKRNHLRRAIRSRASGSTVRLGIDGKLVPYAQIQNEGGTIPVTPNMRRFFWAMYFQAIGKKKEPDGKKAPTSTRLGTAKAARAKYWFYLTRAKKITIPARKYMGHNRDLWPIIDRIIDDKTKELLP